MLPDRFAHITMNLAAIFCALAVPSLAFGRASIGICLALSLLLASLYGAHRQAWAEVKSLAASLWGKGLMLVVLATAVNLPFSVRLGLSFEAWARTWALLFAVYYLLLLLRDRNELIIRALTLFTLLILLASFTPYLNIYKNHINGFLLLIPICLYYCYQTKEKYWWLIGLGLVVAYLAMVLMLVSKASMIGLVLMALATGFLIGLRFFSKIKVVLVTGLATALLAGVIIYWSQNNLLSTSMLYGDLVPIPVSIIDLHRQLIWVFSFDFIWESPLVGFGANASNYHPMANMSVEEFFGPHFDKNPAIATLNVLPAHPHNWVVELMLDTGFIGLAAVVICVICIFVFLFKKYMETHNAYLLVLIAINAGYWGTGLLNFSFWSVWWQVTYFLAACLAYVSAKRGKEA